MIPLKPWIERKFVSRIVKAARKQDRSVDVFIVLAPGGMGKTYSARDAGNRLGSDLGYEPGHTDEAAWSGILDLYDPDTNSNQGLERRLIEAFKFLDPSGLSFEDYRAARTNYDLYFKTGVVGGELEAQRQRVEAAFADGLQTLALKRRLVIAIDTIERIESGADLPEQKMGPREDTVSVMGWLVYQITQVPNCVWLLLGRKGEQLQQALAKAVAEMRSGKKELHIHRIDMERLNADEVNDLFAHRAKKHAVLEQILDPDIREQITRRADGNPLLLDLALQALIETQDPAALREALGKASGIQAAKHELVKKYMDSLADSARGDLLRYLAMARNGLTAELLKFVDPTHAADLIAELDVIQDLPFVKVRQIAGMTPGGKKEDIRTFFLHDEMYVICDTVLLNPQEVRWFSERAVQWYEQQIEFLRGNMTESLEAEQQRRRLEQDLLVASLFYRMRADPVAGYDWYLEREDEAIHTIQTGLDMRLRDAFSIFLDSATFAPSGDQGYTLRSPIDQGQVQARMPRLFDKFLVDSTSLWSRRYTLRGKREPALKVGADMEAEIERIAAQDPADFLLTYAEFQLWYGQAIMYGGNIDQALEIYRQVVNRLSLHYDSEKLNQFNVGGKLTSEGRRACLVLGRTHNNIGYSYWIYKGRFTQAIAELWQAIRLFRIADLREELANSLDNMGRVYARLANEFASIQLIRQGLEIRREQKQTSREILSVISWVMALIRLGKLEVAIRKAKEAIDQLRETNAVRSMGLALYARGIAYRTLADNWREHGLSIEQALEYTNLAEEDLQRALKIFTEAVKEPIRRVRTLNELACAYRTRYLILSAKQEPEHRKDRAYGDSYRIFREAIDQAKAARYEIEEMDSMQDLAVLLTRAGDYEGVDIYLKNIRARIPDEYKIQVGQGIKPLPADDRIDRHYKLMGQVELLAGTVLFRQAGGTLTEEKLVEMGRYYFLAVAYFTYFAGEEYAQQQTSVRIYERLLQLTPEQRELLRGKFTGWIDEYVVPPALVHSLTDGVFKLFG